MNERTTPCGSHANDRAQQLRRAIENLIDAKLLDLVAKSGGLAGGVDRLLAHRRTGVASFDIRMAERKLDEVLNTIPIQEESHAIAG